MALPLPPAVLEAFGDPRTQERQIAWFQQELSIGELTDAVETINRALRASRA